MAKMRFFILLLLSASSLIVFSQQIDSISNSFENTYRKSNPTLKYKYDNYAQIHDYSNNWDFDKDGINGGAHVYYFSFGNGKTKYGSLSN